MTPENYRRYAPRMVGENARGTGSGDRQLLTLITELTDEGMVWPMKSALDTWGRNRVARVIEDGFAVVRQRRHAEADGGLGDLDFISAEEARVLVYHLPKTASDAPDAYVIHAGPWAAIGPEDEPDLIFRYVADSPEAVAQVRHRHAELRQAWEEWLASA
jgi:hypothetical protein